MKHILEVNVLLHHLFDMNLDGTHGFSGLEHVCFEELADEIITDFSWMIDSQLLVCIIVLLLDLCFVPELTVLTHHHQLMPSELILLFELLNGVLVLHFPE